MKHALRWLLIILLCFSFMGTVVSASSLEDNVVPQNQHSYEGKVELEYNKYPKSSYVLDLYIDRTNNPFNISGKIDDGIQAFRLDLLNSVWMFMVVVVNFVIYVVGEAFKLDFVDSIITQITEAIQSIAGFDAGGFRANGLWPILITFIITLVGAWAVYVGMVKREQNRAMSGLLSMILVFGISLGFFSQADKILTQLNGWSKELQNSVLNISGGIVTPGGGYTEYEGIATMQNQMFDVMIYKPYQFMQYGTTSSDASQVLSLQPGSEERGKYVKSEVVDNGNTMMGVDGLGSRTWFLILLFISNLILGGQLLLMAAAVLLFQVIFIAMVLFAPVPLLMALVPAWQSKAFDWAMKTLHALLMKIGFALLMTVMFTISKILYNAVDETEYGYLFVLGMQILCFVGIWLKRKELLSFINTATANITSTARGSLDSYREYRARAREAMQGIPGASAAARFMRYNAMRRIINQRQHVDRGNRAFGAAGTPGAAAAGASLGAAAGAAGAGKESPGIHYTTPEFVDRQKRNPNALAGKAGPTVIDADYAVMDDKAKPLGSNVKMLDAYRGRSMSAAAKQEMKRAAQSPATMGSSGLVERETAAGAAEPEVIRRGMQPREQDAAAFVHRLGHQEAAATRAEPPANLPREGSRAGTSSIESQTGSQSELVHRNRHEQAATIRNENQVDTQHLQRDLTRETHRSQMVSQNEQQHANELIQRNQVDNRTTQRQETNSRTQTETVNRNHLESQDTTRQENHNRHQQVMETTNKNTTERLHRQQNETQQVDKLFSENRNTIRKENTSRQVNTLQEANKSEQVDKRVSENRNVVRKENKSRQIDTLQETNASKQVNLVQRQHVSSFEERVSDQVQQLRETPAAENSDTSKPKGRSWLPWRRKGGRS
ncbi:CD3337/EF1877 family mobilome membrane protein [Paenibacillus cellulositrophicus]|uniref:CD3337/EF1877 family mobilome membrane protein n=1 Tax=Paenibacillus cellulositrophicus TaxID=562959 RepID=UPI003F816CB6